MSMSRRRSRWLSSTALIFYGLGLGVLCGYLFPAEQHPAAYETFRFLSKAFISLIKMLIVPLIFSTIVVGIGKTGDVKAVGHGRQGAHLFRDRDDCGARAGAS